MINSLNKEQIDLMGSVREEWLQKIFSCNNKIDRDKSIEYINWLYDFCGLKKPMIFFVSSPLGCQYAVSYIQELFKQLGRKTEWSQVMSHVESQVWSQIGSHVESQIGSQVDSQVRSQVRSQVGSQVDKYYSFASYGSIWDYGWVSYYDFFEKIGIVKDENFKMFKNMLNTGIYDMIQLDGLCVVCEMPSYISRDDNNRLHDDTNMAIKWDDGYGLYYWHGRCVPEKIITSPLSLTKEDIVSEQNAEIRRCMQEVLGSNEYGKRLGVIEIDSDIDDCGNTQRLLMTEEKDSIINDHIYFSHVICPSTNREYYLCIPPEIGKKKNVWDAIAWTFNKTKETYKPIIQT